MRRSVPPSPVSNLRRAIIPLAVRRRQLRVVRPVQRGQQALQGRQAPQALAERLALQAPRVQLARRATLALQAPRELLERQDLRDPPVRLALLALLARVDRRAGSLV